LKKSICTSGFKDWQLEEVLNWTGQLEIDGIELWIGHIENFQEKHGPLDKLKKLIQRFGYHVPVISGYTTFSSGISGEYDLQKEFKRMERLLDTARQLNCPMVRTFAGNRPSRHASPEQWSQMVYHLKKVMKLADLFEVDIALEIHYDTYADNTKSVKKLIEEVNHPRLKVLFDGANLRVENINQMESLAELYPAIQHIHLKNYKWDDNEWYKGKPVSAFKGDIDNYALIEELADRGYEGFISLEYFGDNKLLNIIESLKNWKRTS